MTKFFRDLVTELLQPSNHLTNCCRLHQAFPATVLFAVAGRAVVVSGVAELDVVVHELPSVGCFKAFIDNHLVHSEHFAMCFGICNQEVLFSEDDVRPDHTCFVLCRPCCLDAVVIIRPSLGRKFWHAQLAALNAFKLQLCCRLLVFGHLFVHPAFELLNFCADVGAPCGEPRQTCPSH